MKFIKRQNGGNKKCVPSVLKTKQNKVAGQHRSQSVWVFFVFFFATFPIQVTENAATNKSTSKIKINKKIYTR